MNEIGKQYSKDDQVDRSGFLKRARRHQSIFRAESLNVPSGTYGNYLTLADGEKGLNFYDGFGIFDAVKQYRKYNEPLYSNMLRSEHIPFNFFIPFRQDFNFLKDVLNEFFNDTIQSITKIEIEYAPKLRAQYLNDATSFDAYLEYIHMDGSNGIIGIELKYTEREYKLKAESKEDIEINDEISKYHNVTNSCGIYKPESIGSLKSDKFRQVWRNQLLGESILITDKDKFKHFTSLTLFPEGNSHFIHASKEYIDLLKENKNKFLPLTYEAFLSTCNKYCPSEKFKNWLDYLAARYIVAK